MTNLSCSAAAAVASIIVHATRLVLTDLEHGRRIDTAGILRSINESAFGASDAAGHWKAAYVACEAAAIVFLHKCCPSTRAKAGSPASLLSTFVRLASLLPSHIHRSEESETPQQFSMPVLLGLVAGAAEGLSFGRVRVMATHLIELPDFTDTMRGRLRVYGLLREIISWKLRMFVPSDASGVGIPAKVLERYPVERVGDREAA
jgi:hypothetical protein